MKSINEHPFNTLLLITMLFGVLLQSPMMAQSKYVLHNTEIVPIKNELTGRDHELIICLPSSYNDATDKEYPVFYFLDGYWHTPLLHSINGLLRFDNVIPEMIMVGLSYPGENANYDSLRLLDLLPAKKTTPNEDTKSPFLTFIEESVIPYMESNYRVSKEEHALGRTSAGGLFTLFAIYKNPDLFRGYVAISPGVIWENNSLLKIDEGYSKKSTSLPVRLFLSAGGEEYQAFRDPILSLQKQIKNNNYQDLSLRSRVIEGERHTGVCAEVYNRELRWIFKDLKPTGPSGLAKIFGEVE